MRNLLFAILTLPLFLLASPLYAQGDANIPMLTRLVQQFTDSEQAIITALKNNNQAALQKFVSDDFELRYSNMPSSPVPRAAWLTQSLKEAKNYNSPLEQMAVHDFTENVVVSFRWQSSFIVDVWVKQQAQWILKVRYAAAVSDKTVRPPGTVVAPSSDIKKMY